MCRICQERPCLPSRIKRGERICCQCFNNTAANRAARQKYRTSEHGLAVQHAKHAENNPKRIWIGERYAGSVATPELAERINAHVRNELDAFKQKQRTYAEDADSWPAQTMSPSGSCSARNDRRC